MSKILKKLVTCFNEIIKNFYLKTLFISITKNLYFIRFLKFLSAKIISIKQYLKPCKKLILKFCLFIILFISFSGQSFATQLPDPIVKLIKSTFPDSNIRFDGLIELKDGTKYIPVLPIQYAAVENPDSIIQSIPAKTNFSSKPDMILFANNLSLLKLLKTTNNKYTLISNNNIPLAVKYGIMPQDLVVPENLEVPAELKIILGNLKAATSNKEPIKSTISSTVNKGPIYPAKATTSALGNLENKTFYFVNNHSPEVYALSLKTGKRIGSVVVSSLPISVAMTDNKKYILTADASTSTVSVIDTTTNKLIKKIDVGNAPNSIVIPEGTNKAYVANRLSSSIFVIDLLNMQVIDEISVTGRPTHLISAEDNMSLYYVEEATNKIYQVALDPQNTVKVITEGSNISTIAQYQNYLSVLCRTDNVLKLFDLNKNEFIKTVKVGEKPLDFKYSSNLNKIYVLSAGTNSIDVIDPDSYEVTKTIQLKGKAFSNKINIFDSGNKAFITSVDAYEIPIIDLKEDKVLDYLPISSPISALLLKD